MILIIGDITADHLIEGTFSYRQLTMGDVRQRILEACATDTFNMACDKADPKPQDLRQIEQILGILQENGLPVGFRDLRFFRDQRNSVFSSSSLFQIQSGQAFVYLRFFLTLDKKRKTRATMKNPQLFFNVDPNGLVFYEIKAI